MTHLTNPSVLLHSVVLSLNEPGFVTTDVSAHKISHYHKQILNVTNASLIRLIVLFLSRSIQSWAALLSEEAPRKCLE